MKIISPLYRLKRAINIASQDLEKLKNDALQQMHPRQSLPNVQSPKECNGEENGKESVLVRCHSLATLHFAGVIREEDVYEEFRKVS